MATVKEKMTAIANPIRSLTKGTQSLTLDDMANRTNQMVEANADLESFLYGTDFGGKTNYDEFWESFYTNARESAEKKGLKYGRLLFSGGGWNITTFKPNFDIVPETGYLLFADSDINGDLVEILKDLGVTLNLSNAQSGYYTFYNSSFTRLGELDFSKADDLTKCFTNSKNLHTIDKLIVSRSISSFTETFYGCPKLENITFDGVLSTSVYFGDSPLLTHESLMSIINALMDYSTSGTTYTLTLGTTNLAKLTDEEKAIATQKGWALS